MRSIHTFLYYLQRQHLFFKYQDPILEILSGNPEIDILQFQARLAQLYPPLLEQTLASMELEAEPYTNPNTLRIKYGDTLYPDEFTRLLDPPLVISVLGVPSWDQEKIAIVGSRRPSQKTYWWLSKELKSILSKPGIISVSGGAIGVDQLVHQASVELKRPTISILPSGLDCIYPRCLVEMTAPILNYGGCLISEFADRQDVRTYHFSHRNRLIAALGKVSIIVEGREKSGSLITAHRALEMGKDVLVVPGHPLDDSFRGNLQLLKMGAHIITQADDLEYLS